MLVLCCKAELSKSLFPFLAIAKQLLEAGLCVQKRFMYSDVSSLLSQLPTALHALVFKVGLWALGHQLSAVLLCWQHGPCCEMWSVSALRAWTGRSQRAHGPVPCCTAQELIHQDWSEQSAYDTSLCEHCHVSQACLPGSCTSSHCNV